MNIKEEGITEEESINISSLVDVMFILIIFFVVTMSFHEQERDVTVNLPQTDKSLSSAAKALVINVRKDGGYYVNGQSATLSDLRAELADKVKSNPDQKVLIRGDRSALHGDVAAAVSVCKSTGIDDANIGYVAESGG